MQDLITEYNFFAGQIIGKLLKNCRNEIGTSCRKGGPRMKRCYSIECERGTRRIKRAYWSEKELGVIWYERRFAKQEAFPFFSVNAVKLHCVALPTFVAMYERLVLFWQQSSATA